MPSLLAGTLEDLPPGRMMEIALEDSRILVCNTGGGLYAMDGTCPHRGAPLAAGALHGHIVVCPFHGWEFDCVTGVCDTGAGIVQRRYGVRLEGGEILVDTEPRA